MKFKWGTYALGGIDGIDSLPGENDYASVARRDHDARFTGWGCVGGQLFEVEASTRGLAKAAVEAKVSELLAAKAAAQGSHMRERKRRHDDAHFPGQGKRGRRAFGKLQVGPASPLVVGTESPLGRSMACLEGRHGDCVPYEGRGAGCTCHCHKPKR